MIIEVFECVGAENRPHFLASSVARYGFRLEFIGQDPYRRCLLPSSDPQLTPIHLFMCAREEAILNHVDEAILRSNRIARNEAVLWTSLQILAVLSVFEQKMKQMEGDRGQIMYSLLGNKPLMNC